MTGNGLNKPPIGSLPQVIDMRTPVKQSGVIEIMSNYNLNCPSRKSLCYLFATEKLLAHRELIETLICHSYCWLVYIDCSTIFFLKNYGSCTCMYLTRWVVLQSCMFFSGIDLRKFD